MPGMVRESRDAKDREGFGPDPGAPVSRRIRRNSAVTEERLVGHCNGGASADSDRGLRLVWHESALFRSSLLRMLFVALLQLTAFAPDEYFQGPEVAHRIVFGYGHVTWEWVAGLRSYLHPMLYIVLYKAGSVVPFQPIVRVITWWGPYALHAFIAAWTVVGAYRLSELVFSPDKSSTRSLCMLNAWLLGNNWFMGYCLTRPYSNSLEAALCTHGLVAYMKSTFDLTGRKSGVAERWKQTTLWVAYGALCVVLRPASGLFWAILAVHALVWPDRSVQRIHGNMAVLGIGITVSGIIFALTTLLDWFMYGRFEVVPWNFFKFNVLEGGSALYGTSPWHANFTMHLPSMLLVAFPAFWYGWHASWRSGHEASNEQTGGGSTAKRVLFLSWCTVLYCLVYSIPAHKEIRFLVPVLPMCMPVVTYGVQIFNLDWRKCQWATSRLYKWMNIVALGYFSLFHQRGQVSVMSSIRSLYDGGTLRGDDGTMSVLFLTPCHATPYYASLHTPNIRMRFFDCSPEAYRRAVFHVNANERSWLELQNVPNGMSERAYFEFAPEKAADEALKAGRPDVVVTSSEGLRAVDANGYKLHVSHWSSIHVFTRLPDH